MHLTVQNYVNGTVSDADDKTVEYEYGAAGMTKLTVADGSAGRRRPTPSRRPPARRPRPRWFQPAGWSSVAGAGCPR